MRFQINIIKTLALMFLLINGYSYSVALPCYEKMSATSSAGFMPNLGRQGQYLGELNTYPANTKGVVYKEKQNLSLIRYQRVFDDSLENQQQRHYIISSNDVLLPLKPEYFSVIEKETGRKLTPNLVRLSAVESQFNYYYGARYYISQARDTNKFYNKRLCKENYGECHLSSSIQFLIKNGDLKDITETYKKTWGYFRIETEEGMRANYTYEFSDIGLANYKKRTVRFKTIKLDSLVLNLDAINDIQPTQYESYGPHRKDIVSYHYNFPLVRFDEFINSGNHDWQMNYYIPDSLKPYRNHLRVITKFKFDSNDFHYINPTFFDCYIVDGPVKMLKENVGYYFYSPYRTDCHDVKGQFAFLEIEDKFYDSKPKRLCGALYD